MNSPETLLLFGGTFDPIHLGHLQTARAVQQAFHFQRFLFLPCRLPVHKAAPLMQTDDRVHVLRLALTEYPIEHAELCLDELHDPRPSYTLTTLQSFRKTVGMAPALTFLLGWDSFCSLPTWERYAELLTHAHLLILKRSETGRTQAPLPPEIRSLMATHQTSNATDLLTRSHGCIHIFDAGHFPISSTYIRHLIQTKQPFASLVTPAVAAYLKTRLQLP